MRCCGLLEPQMLQAWGRLKVLGQLSGGHRNACFKVAQNDRLFVAKTTRRSNAALAWLGPVQEFAQMAGFRVPRLIRSKGGNLSENGWTLEPFLQGHPAQQSETLQFTSLLRRFHQLGKNHIQRPTFVSAKDLLIQTVSGDVDLEDMPKEIVKKCRDAWGKLSDATPCTIHADFGAENILVMDGQAPALIDWDECRVDTPVFDFDADKGSEISKARLAWEIACCWEIEPRRARYLASLL